MSLTMPSFFTHKQSANRIIPSKVSTRNLWANIYSLIHETCDLFLLSSYNDFFSRFGHQRSLVAEESVGV